MSWYSIYHFRVSVEFLKPNFRVSVDTLKKFQGIYRYPKLFRVSTDTLKFQGIYRYPDSTDTR